MSVADLVKACSILIVDDDQNDVRVLSRMLERAGYLNILDSTDPEEVLDQCREWQPDLLLVNLHISGTDGLSLVEAVRSQGTPRSFLPIVGIATDIPRETRFRALLLGVQDVVVKPIDYLDLMLRIRNLLELRCLVRVLQADSGTVSRSYRSGVSA